MEAGPHPDATRTRGPTPSDRIDDTAREPGQPRLSPTRRDGMGVAFGDLSREFRCGSSSSGIPLRRSKAAVTSACVISPIGATSERNAGFGTPGPVPGRIPPWRRRAGTASRRGSAAVRCARIRSPSQTESGGGLRSHVRLWRRRRSGRWPPRLRGRVRVGVDALWSPT